MTRHTPLRRVATAALAGALALTGLVATGSSSSAAPATAGKKLVYDVKDPNFLWSSNCATKGVAFGPKVAAGQAVSRVLTGVQGGASYQIEVPANWNGDLVLWAHGYNGEGTDLCVAPPPLRDLYVSQGFAWAASSYATNGYDVAQGVKDTHGLLGLFRSRVGQPEDVYMTGASMGGHITAVAIEQYPQAFDAAMPICGVLGDNELFDYFLDANVTAAALAGAAKPPFPVDPASWVAYVNGQVTPKLGSSAGPGNLFPSSAAGQAWGAAVQQRSGGTRPGFAYSFAYWNAFGFGAVPQVPFLFGVYPGLTGGMQGQATGNLVDNEDTVYQLDGNPALSTTEQALNAGVLRIGATPQGRHADGLAAVPAISGKIDIPVLTLHDLGDLFVPFSMEQVYAQRVAAHGASDLLTQRAIRATGHCDFTPAELVQGFTDLVTQVRTGTKPAGDDVLDPQVVAASSYGCAFTRGERPGFGTCPA